MAFLLTDTVCSEHIEDKDTWGVAVVGHNINISDGSVVAPKAIISSDM